MHIRISGVQVGYTLIDFTGTVRRQNEMDVPRAYFASRCKFATSLGYLKDELRCV